ncbi:MAG TPA: thiamine pyrophosphate-binding protein, partial [Pirellulales bacterium]|nr:thiamine pyrophosphate-binding protein [Pirellulales bacterium]
MSTTNRGTHQRTGARLLVDSLEAQGVRHVFGIPGAKVDKVFDTLVDSKIRTIVCRHEQNAAFIAGGIGRMTGRAGVVLVTSGPGCSNLVTGLATAQAEGDPIVAIGGAVPLCNRLKHVHQSMDTVSLLRPVTKFCAEIDSPDAVSEVIGGAFRAAESPRPGAAFVSVPQDIMLGTAEGEVLTPVEPESLGAADADKIAAAARLLSAAERPILLLGQSASAPRPAAAVRAWLDKARLPVVCTYQGAGVVPREHFARFGGRVGLFHTQLADQLLDAADVVATVGYDPVEYEPALWNRGRRRKLIHLDAVPADVDRDYRPEIELTGDLACTLSELAAKVERHAATADEKL